MLGDKFNLEYVWIYWLLYISVVGVKLFVLALAAILIEFVYVVALIPGNFRNYFLFISFSLLTIIPVQLQIVITKISVDISISVKEL